ncbi:MAG TPA: hypothetical protein VGJ18_20145 [Gemmatimonadaceae bacterium]
MRPPEPYVGLRPYRENERLLFFGREQDAARLQNTIFAGPLTVLYAPSGVGKTSLLVTFVVPDIRAQHAMVVFFDHWIEDNPCLGIKAAIIAEAAAQGIEVQCASDAPLANIVSAVSAAADRPLVLVLDQFEQFLIKHSADPDPLREELAALVRSESDAHVVLSLRQEFLAALDTFRERILNLFRSTYHLLHLAPDDAARAITEPARLFGGEWDPLLVALLQTELRSEPETADDPGTIHGGGVELPFLQIVCQRLWRDAANSEPRLVLLASYERLGRAPGIIREYVDEVVSALSREDRADMAAVLDYLAPHSGAKMSYALQDLVERTVIPEPRVLAVLQLLSKHMVVREREVGHTRRYELNHDAFIRVLRPWVDAELIAVRAQALEERRQRLLEERVRRWGIRGIAAGAVLLLALITGPRVRDWMSTDHALSSLAKRLTHTPLVDADWAQQSAEARQIFDGVTAYLARDGSERSLDVLDEKLHRYDTLVTRYYAEASEGTNRHASDRVAKVRQAGAGANSTTSFGQIAEEGGGARRRPSAAPSQATLGLDYAQLKDLGGDSVALSREWSTLARHLTRTLGIPLPLELALSRDDTLPARTALLDLVAYDSQRAGAETTHVRMRLVLPPRDSLIVGEAGLPEHLRSHYFRGAPGALRWAVLDHAQAGGPYHFVPLWTAPVWSVYGRRVVPRERAVALSIAAKLLEDRSVLLNRELVRYMLDRERERAPRTVDEFLASPNAEERIYALLTELVRDRRPISSLGHVIDVLTDHPAEPPSQLAARLEHAPWQHVVATTPRATGPVRTSRNVDAATRARLDSRYGAIVDLLPIDQPTLRVFAGAAAIDSLVNAGEQGLQPAIADSLMDLGAELYRDFGLSLPDIRFDMDTAIGPNEFRIELLTQTRGDVGTGAMSPKPADLLPQVTAALRTRLRATRSYLVRAETVDSLMVESSFPTRRAAWLRQNFSVSDLKRMLRAVVTPAASELSSLGDSVRPLPRTSAEYTIANPQWMLGSLVFWNVVGRPTNLDSAASYFRALQKERIASDNADPDPAMKVTPLYAAVYELEMDSSGLGVSRLRRVADSVPADIRVSFSRTYATTAAYRQLLRLFYRCALPDLSLMEGAPSLSPVLVPELEAWVARAPASKLAATFRPRLELCLMGSYTAAKRYRRAARQFDRLATEGVQRDTSWTPEDVFRLSLWTLMSPDIDSTSNTLRGRAVEMLLGATRSMKLSQAEATAQPLEALCSKTHASPLWCRSMVDSLVRMRRDSPFLALYFGNARADADRPEEARESLMLLDSARSRLARAATRNEGFQAWTRFSRAKAFLVLAEQGQRKQLVEATTELRSVLASLPRTPATGWPRARNVYASLIDVQTLAAEYDAARATLERVAALPDSGEPWITRHFLYLAGNRPDSALHLADSLLHAQPKDWAVLFAASTSQLLADRPEAEKTARQFIEDTGHDYRDYVRLMLYWSLSRRGTPESQRDARELLEERWSEVDSLTWSQRLLHRDKTVWREMLIGYYLGKVPTSRVLGHLANQSVFERSELAPLGYSLDALRCEAFLYDALLQSVTGPLADRRQRQLASLDKAIATKYYIYYEYHYARMLRDR